MRTRLFVLLLAASTSAPAQQLGTLFHSPKERETLDRMRRGESVDRAVAPLPDPVVTGYVKRSDGKSTVFIDKRPYPARDPRLQGVLDPRIVDRYDPVPPMPPPIVEPGPVREVVPSPRNGTLPPKSPSKVKE